VNYVDGKLRADGVRAFLASRGIDLPEGEADDPPEADTVHGLGTRKNDIFLALLRERGVEVYSGSVDFLESVKRAGHPCAVVSASTNCADILAAASLTDLFDARIDGVVARERSLLGKPAPDMFLAAAEALGVTPANCAVFEDATAGVAAGRAGSFGWVVGIDRTGNADMLLAHGADIVVGDLSELVTTQ
jgi:HAD superfamily hydrolase (TIGR01509 family)